MDPVTIDTIRGEFPELAVEDLRITQSIRDAKIMAANVGREAFLLAVAHLCVQPDIDYAGEVKADSIEGRSATYQTMSSGPQDVFWGSSSYGQRFLQMKKSTPSVGLAAVGWP